MRYLLVSAHLEVYITSGLDIPSRGYPNFQADGALRAMVVALLCLCITMDTSAQNSATIPCLPLKS